MRSLTYVEIDIDFCANIYGVAPCTASIPTTGSAKCYNSIKTCQDRVNFNNSPVTLRFAVPTSYLPADIDAIPSIKSVAFTPAVLNAGVDLGQRASVAVTFTDHPHPDTGPGFDKYVTERPYNPYEQGTFFGKFRARQPFLRGRPFRLIRGKVGDALADMETRHYLIDSFTGPNTDGTYTLIAKDVLKLADDDRSQAPAASSGTLASNITSDATSCSLSPTGIGALEYPASGYVAIGGKEICAFTRSGDTLTLTRAQFNTTAQAHNAQDRVQLCLYYNAEDPADIIKDLLETYVGLSASYIDLTAWKAETAAYLQRVYTALIAEPTGVYTLISELIEQAALAIWWDDVGQALRLQVLRAIPADAATFDQENTIGGTLQIQEQPDKRVSEVWTYFGLRNPCEPIDRLDNYQSIYISLDEQAETDYGSAAIKRIFSRWIPQFGGSIASRLGALVLGRYRDPPRAFTFGVLRGTATPSLGGGYRLESWALQDESGAAATIPVQVTQIDPDADVLTVSAEESTFLQYDDSFLFDRTITIDTDTLDFNLRTVHDSLFSAIVASDLGSPGVSITVNIAAAAKVGSSSVLTPAFDVGDWPVLPPITINVLGRIEGHGGNGGSYPATTGQNGGTALKTRVAIQLNDASGEIWGGGGGGPGTNSGGNTGNGGGGAGYLGGYGPSTGQYGTPDAGTPGDFGGSGGGPGQPGQPSRVGAGVPGAAGNAIDGISHVTTVGSAGDRRGGQVN